MGDVRCVGLLAGIEFVKDRKSKKPFPEEMGLGSKLQRICLKNGLNVYPGRVSSIVDGGDHIMLAPPYIITEDELDMVLHILDRSMTELESELPESCGCSRQ